MMINKTLRLAGVSMLMISACMYADGVQKDENKSEQMHILPTGNIPAHSSLKDLVREVAKKISAWHKQLKENVQEISLDQPAQPQPMGLSSLLAAKPVYAPEKAPVEMTAENPEFKMEKPWSVKKSGIVGVGAGLLLAVLVDACTPIPEDAKRVASVALTLAGAGCGVYEGKKKNKFYQVTHGLDIRGCVAEDNLEGFNAHIARGVHINEVDSNLRTLAHYMAANGSVSVAPDILKSLNELALYEGKSRQVEPAYIKDVDGNLAALWAAQCGNYETFKQLMDATFDQNGVLVSRNRDSVSIDSLAQKDPKLKEIIKEVEQKQKARQEMQEVFAKACSSPAYD